MLLHFVMSSRNDAHTLVLAPGGGGADGGDSLRGQSGPRVPMDSDKIPAGRQRRTQVVVCGGIKPKRLAMTTVSLRVVPPRGVCSRSKHPKRQVLATAVQGCSAVGCSCLCSLCLAVLSFFFKDDPILSTVTTGGVRVGRPFGARWLALPRGGAGPRCP